MSRMFDKKITKASKKLFCHFWAVWSWFTYKTGENLQWSTAEWSKYEVCGTKPEDVRNWQALFRLEVENFEVKSKWDWGEGDSGRKRARSDNATMTGGSQQNNGWKELRNFAALSGSINGKWRSMEKPKVGNQGEKKLSGRSGHN